MAKHYAVSELGRRFNVPPKVISDAFYLRKLDDAKCPIVGGRRLIPESYVPQVEAYLRAAGHLRDAAGVGRG